MKISSRVQLSGDLSPKWRLLGNTLWMKAAAAAAALMGSEREFFLPGAIGCLAYLATQRNIHVTCIK